MKGILSDIRQAITGFFSSLFTQKSTRKYKRYSNSGYPRGARGGRPQGSGYQYKTTSNGRDRSAGFVLNKKRFTSIVAVACAAVMIPVLVVSANPNADQTLPEQDVVAQADTGNDAVSITPEPAPAGDVAELSTDGGEELPINENNEIDGLSVTGNGGNAGPDTATVGQAGTAGAEAANVQADEGAAEEQPNEEGQPAGEAETALPQGETTPDGTQDTQPNEADPAGVADESGATILGAAEDGTLPEDGQQVTDPAAEGTEEVQGTEGTEGETPEVTEPVQADNSGYTPMVLVPEVYSSEVIKLQQRLMELNYMDDDEPTEYYGGVTQQAVKYFQRKHELPVDGVAGVETQQLLFSDQAKVYTVSFEADGPDVEGIQQRLQDLGYNVSATGYFGEETESAVKYFQRMNNLTDDGSVGEYTKELLYSDDAIPAEKPKVSSSGKKSSGGGNKSSGGGGGGGGSSYTANPGSVEAMISVAMAQVGKPYVRGGKGPDNFDCSGLVYYALSASGNGIGYMTSGGWAGSGYTTIGSIGELQRGDIICFSGHVGIYLGGGTMVDASSSNGAIVVRSCTGSWSVNNFICGKRPL